MAENKGRIGKGIASYLFIILNLFYLHGEGWYCDGDINYLMSPKRLVVVRTLFVK